MSIPSTAWMSRAACRGHDPDMFFPDKRGNQAVAQAREAQAICERCPVAQECATFAVEGDTRFGVWGSQYLSGREFREPGPRTVKPIDHGTSRGYKAHLRRGEKACDGCIQANRVACKESYDRTRARHA